MLSLSKTSSPVLLFFSPPLRESSKKLPSLNIHPFVEERQTKLVITRALFDGLQHKQPTNPRSLREPCNASVCAIPRPPPSPSLRVSNPGRCSFGPSSCSSDDDVTQISNLYTVLFSLSLSGGRGWRGRGGWESMAQLTSVRLRVRADNSIDRRCSTDTAYPFQPRRA